MPADTIDVTTAAGLSLGPLADLMTASFEGYVVPLEMPTERLATLIRCETVDLVASRIAVANGKPVAITLVAARGLARRIAAMGVIRERRGQGIGRRMLREIVDESRALGFRRLQLEVIEDNTPARELYRSMGFEEIRTLVGWDREPLAPADTTDGLVEIPSTEIASVMEAEGLTDLPWQLAPATIACHAPPSTALRLGRSARALVSSVGERSATIEAIVVDASARRQGRGRQLLEALARRYPGRGFRVPARVPSDLGREFFEATGFVPNAIRQKEMTLPL